MGCGVVGAGGGNRTPISSLENWGLNHYTTPAHISLHISWVWGRQDNDR